MGVRSATCMDQALDQSGSMSYTAKALRRSLETVVTEAGAVMTALTLKTSPLSAIMIPRPKVWIL